MNKTKRIKQQLSLMLLLIAMLMPQGVWAISGNGTSVDPYIIDNEDDLISFQQIVEKSYPYAYGKLTSDITLTKAWTRIGRSGQKFRGNFDGQGHTISGMNLSFTAYEHGFFGFVENATIKNFTLTGTMTSSANGNHSHGTVVGSAAGTTVIENVTSSVNLTLNHTGFTCIGGIVGHIAGSTKVTGCTYNGTINLNKDSEQVGGIVGYAQEDLYITDNVFSGTITSTGTCKYLAGIAGKTDGTIEVSGCTNIGTINGGPSYDCVAGIVGYVQYQSRALITNCYFGGSLSSTTSKSDIAMGGILGAVNDDAGTNFRGLTYCFSDGTLTATNSSSTQIGGIAGVVKNKAVSMVKNNTYLSGKASRISAIVGSLSFDASNKAITISVTAGTGGTVSKSYVYPTSTTAMQLHVEATPTDGYHYVKWSDNGAQTHNVFLTDNVSLTATFGAHTYGDWITDVAATCTSEGTHHRVCTHTGCGARENGTIAVAAHTFAANDAAKGVCTVCQHGFLRYTSKNNVVVTPITSSNFGFYNGNTKLSILSNANGVIEFNKPLTQIGEHTFTNAQNLTSVTFPGTLTSIGDYAFEGCSGLSGTLTIPSSVTSIGKFVFNLCWGVSGTLTIPSSVTSIGTQAFANTNITTVRNECTTPQYYSAIFTNSANMALRVPASALQAYKAANGWKSFKSITCIDHNYSKKSTDAKYSINAETCTTTGQYYYSCSVCGEKDTNNTFTVAALGHNYGAAVWSWADDGHSATCSRTCGRTGCTTNTTGHTSSKSVTLGNGIASEQQVAPTCTTKGTTRYTATAIVENVEYKASKDVDDIATLPHTFANDDITQCKCTVCNHGFFRYHSPNHYEGIITNNLRDADGKTPIALYEEKDIPGRWVLEFNAPLVTIGERAFSGCGITGDLRIPNTVTTIGAEAFADCSALNGNLVITNSVTTIEREAFRDCSNLANLITPDLLISNGNGSYHQTINGRGSVYLPNSVTTIGDHAFQNCFNGGQMIVPNSVRYIGDGAFGGSSFTSIQLYSIPQIGSGFPRAHLNSITAVLSDDSYVYTGSNPYFPEVSSVTYNRNIVKDGGMYSFIVPFDIPADKAAELGKFYKYEHYDKGQVFFDDIAKMDDGIVKANTAYFFDPAKDISSITVENPNIDKSGNMADAANPSEPGLYGTYSQKAIPAGAFGYGAGGKFVKAAGTGNKLSPFRAYLWLGDVPMSNAYAFFDFDTTTAINTMEADSSVGIEDVDSDMPMYNLQGQRILNPQKGDVYIKNGKKFIKK